MTGWRLADGGSVIDRTRPLSFTWAGRRYFGFAGDTLASALLANGVSIVGRSFKYHRPRGLLAAGLEEPNGIVQLESGANTVPNLKATQIELYEGLIAAPVNTWPSPTFDLLAANSLIKRFIPAAFYYKTFLWPRWSLFEPFIRKAAGLGKAPSGADPDQYEHRYDHVDTLIVGSGAAGLAAAESAARANPDEDILLVEAEPEIGGDLLSAQGEIEGLSPSAWRTAALARLSGLSNVRLMSRTMAFGFYDHGMVALCERLTDHLAPNDRAGARQRLWKVRCRRAILATGAFEQPLAFGGNDLPGVMLASAAATYVGRFGAVPGRRVVLTTNNDSGYDVAFTLQNVGVEIVAILDSRPSGAAASNARERSIRVLCGSIPLKAKGRNRVRAMLAGAVDGGPTETFRCDTVLMAGGWNPVVHLHSQSGGSLIFDRSMEAFVPDACAQSAISVGAARGTMDMPAALSAAREAGRGAPAPEITQREVGPIRRFADGAGDASTAWLDFQNDVTVADVQLAVRENFRSVEHLKRYTTLGMASDQGKTSNVAAIRVLSDLIGRPAEAIGTTKFRPPYDPVTIGCFAGRAVGDDLMPLAHLSAHAEHLAMGARMEPYGGWLRAAYFSLTGENEEDSVSREVTAVRQAVGLFEASPLGKIEVKGPDAAEFLQRMYVNDVRSLEVGRCRYGLMLNEHGIVHDDGIFTRLAENHFLIGTTSGHALDITDRFEEWLQCEWPALNVMVENVTTAWAVMNLAGPKARDTLRTIGTDIDLAPEAFPHMAFRAGTVGGVPARVQRVSFSGEVSYEVAVPWRYGASLWQGFLRAGKRHRITPVGVEALMTLRVEKGFLHVGADTDGTTYPQDVGFGTPLEKKPDDFVGRRSAMRPDAKRSDRRQLIGIEVVDGGPRFPVGSHVLPFTATEPGRTEGWVTSSVTSPTLGRPLALALLVRGRQRIGETVKVWHLGAWRTGRIADARFFDPAGERQHG